jgi:hypothetical protein
MGGGLATPPSTREWGGDGGGEGRPQGVSRVAGGELARPTEGVSLTAMGRARKARWLRAERTYVRLDRSVPSPCR